MNRLRMLATISYASFILFIIYLAGTGSDSLIFAPAQMIPYGDKLGHFILIGVLTYLVVRNLGLPRVCCLGIQVSLGALLIAVGISIEEISQNFLESRTADPFDFSANLLGIVFFHYLAEKRRPVLVPRSKDLV